MRDPKKFIESLSSLNIDRLPKAVRKKLEKYIGDELFSPEAVTKSSFASAGLCTWVIAVNDYC